MIRHALLIILLVLPVVLAAEQAEAPANAWVMSIPHAESAKGLYKLRIVAIDDERQPDAVRYALKPGSREIRVELMLDVEWEPDLSSATTRPSVKKLILDATAGKSYRIGRSVAKGKAAADETEPNTSTE